jgi:hypothetical protein
MAEKKAAKPPQIPDLYFDVRDESYWFKVNGTFSPLKKTNIQMEFRTLGLRDDIYHDGLRELDWPLWNAMKNKRINYAGPLAGHRVGTFHDTGGRNYLVTEEARGVFDDLPKKFKDPEFFMEFASELLPDGQADYLFYWLAIALRSLRKGDFRPGQVLVFAGPVQCGKSLMQYIITEIFGGRGASPMRYMMEETTFNKDVAGAEHWFIEEPKTGTDTRTRIQFGNAIKECFNNRDFSIHAKGKEAITLPIWRRGTISVNNDPELLMVLPPLNGSVDDKMMLFNCAPVVETLKEFCKNGDQDRTRLWQTIIGEIPAVRAWLLASFKTVPKSRRDTRFGITAWHHPDLRKDLLSFTSEARLLNIIDEAFFSGAGPHSPMLGRAMELEKKLKDSPFGFEAEKMLRYTGQFGSLLGKIKKLHPERITKEVLDGYTTWIINPPSRKP